jgi:DNA repair exonuclease SbcCD ATPase subunit
LQAAVVEKERRDKIVLPDVEKLRGQWDVVRKVEEKIAEYRRKSDNIGTLISEKTGTVNSLKSRVRSWEVKGGKVCVTCEQEVESAHTRSKIEPLMAEIEKLDGEVVALQCEQAKVNTAVNAARQMVAQKKPEQSIGDANGVHTQWRRHDDEIKRLRSSAAKVDVENNPHERSLADVRASLASCVGEVAKAEKEVERDTFLCHHYWYIHKAYNDRTKIKSYVFQDHIPFINGRLRHYLDVFGLDVQVELTASLGIQSNMWGYDFESGGERKRTDVAFMLAMFDFHEQMYGRQCNIMILDEVDGRLDDDGIDALINVIKNDLAPKVEAILIISHRQNMFDMFPKQICVERKDRFSYIKEIV